MTDSELIAQVREILFPEGDEDHECGSYELGELCNLLLSNKANPPILSGSTECQSR